MINTAVPFEEAAAVLADKPAVTRAVFDQLLPELQARAFTITGVDTADALQAARDAIATIPRGEDWRVVKKEIAAALDPWLGEQAERRVELLMRHHAYHAYAVANVRNLDANTDLFPYRQYMSAQDERVRDTHAALNGIVLPADSPFWDRHTPPWEYGCRCDVRGVTAEEADELREADAAKDPEKRRVLDGAVKDRLERENRLERGVNEIFDVRTPTERGETGPDWSSKDLTIPLDVLRSRYDAQTWKRFTDWAGETEVEGLGTVWQWLIGEASVSAPASQPGKAALAALLIQHRSNFPPVGGAFVDKSGETVRHAEAVAKVIDEMHGDGQLPPISLNAPPDPDAFGYFERHPSLATARLWVDGKGPSPRLTAAHEIGHALDWYGFGNGGSVSASTTLAEFSGWRQAVQASDAIAKIATAPLPVKTRDYLLRPREIWARSYAQWVAVRSGNPALRSELQLELRKFGGIGIQWESSDFDPIAAEIDQLFGALGWLRPTQP